jgi:hypothetical protein
MKKKKFIDVDLFKGGKPCTPGKFRELSKEECDSFMERFEEAKRLGKVVTLHKSRMVTEHEYLDHLINENIEIENYEECARILKIKNETPYSEKITRFIDETF